MATKKLRYTVSVDDEMFNAIENFRFENRFQTRSEATVELIRLGMEQLKRENERKPLDKYGKPTELTEEQHKKAKEEARKLLEGATSVVSTAAFDGDGVESTILTEEQNKRAREEARKLLEGSD